MESIQKFGQSASAGGDDGGMPSAGGDASGGDSSMASASGSSGTYDKLQAGGSAISILSKFGMAMNKARSLRDQAQQSGMEATQEYLQSQAASNEITRRLNGVIGAQQATAAAGNVDVASGSVTEAGRQAQLEASRAETLSRNMAIMNASQRRARMFALKQSAGVQTFTAWANLAMDTATTVAKAMGGGAPGGGAGGGDPSAMMGE